MLEQAEKSRGLVTHDILNTNLNWDKQRSDLILGEISLEMDIEILLFHPQIKWLDQDSCGWTVRDPVGAVSSGLPASSPQL